MLSHLSQLLQTISSGPNTKVDHLIFKQENNFYSLRNMLASILDDSNKCLTDILMYEISGRDFEKIKKTLLDEPPMKIDVEKPQKPDISDDDFLEKQREYHAVTVKPYRDAKREALAKVVEVKLKNNDILFGTLIEKGILDKEEVGSLTDPLPNDVRHVFDAMVKIRERLIYVSKNKPE